MSSSRRNLFVVTDVARKDVYTVHDVTSLQVLKVKGAVALGFQNNPSDIEVRWESFGTVVSSERQWKKGEYQPYRKFMLLLPGEIWTFPETLPLPFTLFALINRSDCDSILEDPAWFYGLHSKVTSKRVYIRELYANRLKNYWKEMTKKIAASPAAVQAELAPILAEMRARLDKADMYRGSFDVLDKILRLCDGKGRFHCKGEASYLKCRYKCVVVNPWANIMHRKYFSHWDLDHLIEKGKAFSGLIKAAEEKLTKGIANKINVDYFFELIFGGNMRLVMSIFCHEKTQHPHQVDEAQFYI